MFVQDACFDYYKRFRMEIDLSLPPQAVPDLPAGFYWVPWEESLLETHAAIKFACFQEELDSQVFASLASHPGCLQLMREIRARPGFVPQATWLIAGPDGFCATIQGVGDGRGTGCIQNVGVLAPCRGMGLGAALVLRALHGFRAAGLARGMLEVTARNETAVRLYRRLGFRRRKTLYKMVEAPVAADDPVPLWQI